VKNLKAEAINYKTIQLTWDAFDGATSYIVERLSGDEWIEVAQTSEPAYTAEGVKTGKEYTYRVKADNADYSKEVSVTTTLNGEVELSIAPNGDLFKCNLSNKKLENINNYSDFNQMYEGWCNFECINYCSKLCE
jgi:predicted phage tail protein